MNLAKLMLTLKIKPLLILTHLNQQTKSLEPQGYFLSQTVKTSATFF
jgi:hypothetical protein